ncbi:MAG: sulfatase [Planctomycetota bacterium]
MNATLRALTFAGACATLIAVGFGQSTFAAPADRPNVIVILADDLGFGDLGCYGHPKFKTPNLDRMAAEGVRFTQFITPMPFCAPTRAALLTGRYPFHTGIWGNPTPDRDINDLGIADEEQTLAEAFKDAGYATGMVGKWHLGHKPEFYPIRHGFDEYFGILYSNDMRPVQLVEQDRVVEYPVVQATLTKRYTARATDFIARNRERPFFFYFAHAMPHKPLACSEDFYQKTGTGLYGDVVAELDWSVGKVLGALKEAGLDERTLVIFTSDNGAWYGGSTGGLRGMKTRSWEGGVRVPMIARWPGRIPGGRNTDVLSGIIDVFPTALEAAQIPLPKQPQIDGRSLLPLLVSASGEKASGSAASPAAPAPHEAMVIMRGATLAAVRTQRWKLHVLEPGPDAPKAGAEPWVDPRAPDGVTILAPFEQYGPEDYPGVPTGVQAKPMMLFDLENDPAEQTDVAAEHPEVVKELKSLFDRLTADAPAEVKKRAAKQK